MKLNQKNFAFTLAFFLIVFACNNSENKTATTLPGKGLIFDKLVGTWQSENSKSFERWTKNNDGTFRSDVFSIKGSDTSWSEQADIYPENDKWIFENTVRGQNEGKAIQFTSSILNENSVQFSNPEHDFPTDVNYTVVNANTLHAFIIGPNNKGGRDTIPFNYRKAK